MRLRQIAEHQQFRGVMLQLVDGILRHGESALLSVDRACKLMLAIVGIKPIVRNIVRNNVSRVEVFILQQLSAHTVDADDAACAVDDQNAFTRIEKQASIDIVRPQIEQPVAHDGDEYRHNKDRDGGMHQIQLLVHMKDCR